MRAEPVVTAVTTWYLEQTSPEALRPAAGPDAAEGLSVVRAERTYPAFNRFLYTAVGGDWSWTDRLPWTHRQWEEYLGRDGTETWVAWVRGTPAGYVELSPSGPGEVEIAYFGLVAAFHGRGIGSRLLAEGLARAWDLADRWPALGPTRRVWVHTCSLDGPAALRTYRSRGMEVYDVRTADEEVRPAPGPWPGARGE
ncbi:GNAT family N-acetyltransferase [Streptacidiphilus sp. ASG 303]|uniref:GNAT family N-acetyltransferase n=1 Tax=Streptacidiphilus sp. ASG 303 TaxID=2896847 RepID=UPI001E4FDD9D|nr:GNAT family N-acetyltransferase [Streptacidiphilus sp. ASG 303]MCD0481661.1 GNAT family N-acetyltransferase [Streptacidiphilus sp. ASG 303]